MNSFSQYQVICQENSLRCKTWSLALSNLFRSFFSRFFAICTGTTYPFHLWMIYSISVTTETLPSAIPARQFITFYLERNERSALIMVLTFQVLTLYFSFLWLISKCQQRWPGPLYHRQGCVVERYGILSAWNKVLELLIHSLHLLCTNDIQTYPTFFLQCFWKAQNRKSISNDPSAARKNILCTVAGICKSNTEKAYLFIHSTE